MLRWIYEVTIVVRLESRPYFEWRPYQSEAPKDRQIHAHDRNGRRGNRENSTHVRGAEATGGGVVLQPHLPNACIGLVRPRSDTPRPPRPDAAGNGHRLR